MHDVDATRRSWNAATRNHNAHKGDQAAFLRAGGDTLFPEELGLLGDVAGRRLVHLQCNAGQDSLCLARRGAEVTGVDLSDEAIGFARGLALAAGVRATFVEAEVVAWLEATPARFDLAFCSYGVVGWLPDVDRWARGVARVLAPGGRLVYVDFHPLVWSLDGEGRLRGDDYFARAPFCEPVGDYVAASGAGLLHGAPPVEGVGGDTVENTVPAQSWQHTLGAIVTAVAGAGLRVEALHEYPWANGCKVNAGLVEDGRRWVWPEGVTRAPLMFGLTARRG